MQDLVSIQTKSVNTAPEDSCAASTLTLNANAKTSDQVGASMATSENKTLAKAKTEGAAKAAGKKLLTMTAEIFCAYEENASKGHHIIAIKKVS